MPHIVIQGPVDLEAYAREFEPILLRTGADVIRADTLYRDRSGRALLLEALVVEAGRKLPFYLKITSHDRGSVTIRIDPLTHPERSDGVRSLVARIGRDLIARNPGARVLNSDLLVPCAAGQKGDSE
ncbi:MAG: hypothetical protein HRU00_00495 [Myxococcales bacterium]|nr:hypothetical protein [Myxococcales bacterium]